MGTPSAAAPRIAIIGAGNIGGALLGGILKGGLAPASHITATVQSLLSAEALGLKYPGIRVTCGGNLEAAESSDVVILAVKPAALPAVLEQIRWGLRESRTLISLAAAFPIVLIEQIVGRTLPGQIIKAGPSTRRYPAPDTVVARLKA